MSRHNRHEALLIRNHRRDTPNLCGPEAYIQVAHDQRWSFDEGMFLEDCRQESICKSTLFNIVLPASPAVDDVEREDHGTFDGHEETRGPASGEALTFFTPYVAHTVANM